LAYLPSYSHLSLKRLGIGELKHLLALLLSSGLNNSTIDFIDLSKANIDEENYSLFL
jgi:hypothetical protein